MLFRKTRKPIVPIPYHFYFFPVFAIALIGLLDSVYLAISHYRNYADMGYQSFCAISKALNCDTVSQSPYSIFLDVPVPVWGILGYGFFLFLLSFAWNARDEKKRMWTLIMVISFGFSLYSLILAFISSYYIHSYCIMCILSYGVNLALLFYAWIIRKRFDSEFFFKALKLDIFYLLNFRKISISVTSAFGIVAFLMILFFPTYWLMDPPEFNGNIPTGLTKHGHPWIGAEDPELEIVEFSDYRCFQCKKMHYFLRRLIEANPDKLRLVHRQFPMDHAINPLVTEPFHSGSAKLSMLAIYAGEQGKFWKMNDYLFGLSRGMATLKLKDIATDVGLEYETMQFVFQDQHLWNRLWAEIKEGIKEYGLTGTPGFIINGKVHLGQIPAEILKPYI